MIPLFDSGPFADGMTSYLAMPNWIVLLVLEIITVVVEVTLIVAYWKMRGNKLRWYELSLAVVIANVITALVGLAYGQVSSGQDYAYGDGVSTIFGLLFGALFVCGIVAFATASYVWNGKEAKSLQPKDKEDTQ
jgi:hypothetical protein